MQVGRSLGGLDPWTECVLLGRLAGRPLTVAFSGRARLAQDLGFLFDGGRHGPGPEERLVTFSGGLLGLTGHRFGSARPPSDVFLADGLLDFVSRSLSPTAFAPYLAAVLPLEATLDEQIARVRSSGQRRRLRRAADRGAVAREAGPGADFATFYETLYRPWALERFGADASVTDRGELERMLVRRGTLLLVEESGEPVAGALVYRSSARPGTLFWWKSGVAPCSPGARGTEDRFQALELAVLRYAFDHGFAEVNLGLTRAVAADGVFVHKRRLGCTFRPVAAGDELRLTVSESARPGLLAARPLVVRHRGRLECWHGFGAGEGEEGLLALERRLEDSPFPGLEALRLFAPPEGREALRVLVARLDARIASLVRIDEG